MACLSTQGRGPGQVLSPPTPRTSHIPHLYGSAQGSVFLSHIYALWKNPTDPFPPFSKTVCRHDKTKVDSHAHRQIPQRWPEGRVMLEQAGYISFERCCLDFQTGYNYVCAIPTHGIPSVPLRFWVVSHFIAKWLNFVCLQACKLSSGMSSQWVTDPSGLKCCSGFLRHRSVDQRSSNFGMHRNHLEGLLKHRCRRLPPHTPLPRVSGSEDLGVGPETAFLTSSEVMLMLLAQKTTVWEPLIWKWSKGALAPPRFWCNFGSASWQITRLLESSASLLSNGDNIYFIEMKMLNETSMYSPEGWLPNCRAPVFLQMAELAHFLDDLDPQ